MENNGFIHEPGGKEIEMMLAYVPAYSEDSGRNIKQKFEAKAKMRRKRVSFAKLALGGAAAAAVSVTTLAYAQVIDISAIYRVIFGENSAYVEQYIEPLNGAAHALPANESGVSGAGTSPAESAPPASIQSEHDGIVIKLISAINDENSLRIFAAVTDTTGDRLDESLDLSWGLSQGNGGGAEVVDYNNETKTATVMITSLGENQEGNATLWVKSLSNGRELLENLPEEDINIGNILKEHSPGIISQAEVWKNGGGGNNRKIYEESRLLKPDEMSLPLNSTDKFSISNAGFVDGRLHIQAKTALEGAALTEGYYIDAKFLDAEKEIIYNSVSRIDFAADKKYARQEHAMTPHDAYSEMIFEGIADSSWLEGLTLAIDYMNPPVVMEGGWELAFTVPDKAASDFQVDRELLINGEKMKIGTVSLSPLGLTVHLPKDVSKSYSHSDISSVEYDDGTVVELPQSSVHTYEGASTLVFGGRVIEIERVRKITLNNESIDILQ